MDISEVVALAARVEADLGKLRSRSALVVMFADLVGSTEFKAQHPAEEDWLPRLCKFLLGVTRIVEADGRVVKYIGDEVMGVFEGDNAPLAAEQAAERILQFCEQLPNEGMRVKLALDYGEVNLLDFSQTAARRSRKHRPALHASDPNGLVVDRCARLMSESVAGAVLCSAQFRATCRAPDRWRSVGRFHPRGLAEPVEVFQLQTRGAPDVSIVDETMTLFECKAELAKVQNQLAELKRLNRRLRQ